MAIVLSSQLFTREQIEEHTAPEDPDNDDKIDPSVKDEKDAILKPTLQIHSQLVQ